MALLQYWGPDLPLMEQDEYVAIFMCGRSLITVTFNDQWGGYMAEVDDGSEFPPLHTDRYPILGDCLQAAMHWYNPVTPLR